uniref:Major facilitator superfamily (MFS) profile domain-containing protein n=1 Tax=Timema shepardi TaxID=629360 RepID=A0A7R9B7D7_TIMSH|nr:unnamed protein product [Timema shepardi]
MQMDSGETDIPASSGEQSWIGSLTPLGAVFSPFLAGYAADRWGRKYHADSHGVSRHRGLGSDSLRRACADKVRGALGSLLQIMISFGLLSQYVVGPYVSYLVLTIFSVMVPFLFVAAMWFIPESPYQLIMVRKNQQALESLQWLRGTKSEAVKEELAVIETYARLGSATAADRSAGILHHHNKSPSLRLSQENVRDMLANKATPRDLIATKATVTALYLSMGLVSLQQLTGINAILFYCQTIFESSGSGLDSSVATIIVGTVMLLASTCTPFVVDSLGRRILLLFSAGGMAVSLAALGTFFHLQNNGSDTSSIGWLPVVSLVVYILVYSVGFGSLPWAVMGELFTPNVKSMASSVSASICWFFAFLITKFFSTLSQELGSDYAIWIFGIFAVVAFVVGVLPPARDQGEVPARDTGHPRRIDAQCGWHVLDNVICCLVPNAIGDYKMSGRYILREENSRTILRLPSDNSESSKGPQYLAAALDGVGGCHQLAEGLSARAAPDECGRAPEPLGYKLIIVYIQGVRNTWNLFQRNVELFNFIADEGLNQDPPRWRSWLNALVVLSSTAEDGDIERQLSPSGVLSHEPATIGAFVAGTFMSWTSPALPLLQANSSVPYITSEEGSWIGSLLNLGAFIGAIPAGILADHIGRRTTLCGLAVPFFVSWLMIAFCSSALELYVGRILGGMAVGAVSVVAPMYISELADSKVRGALGTFFQLQITLGILCGYLVGMVGDHRVLAFILSVLPVVYFVSFIWMPESPVYLLSKDKQNEARRSLQWFRGSNYDIEDEMVRMTESSGDSQKRKGGLGELLSNPVTRRALTIALGLMMFQQLSGVNAVIFYTGQIFDLAGSSIPSVTACIIIGVVQVIATYVSTLLVDRAGRRILLLISDSVMALCLGVLGAYFHLLNNHYDTSDVSWVPIVSVAIFIVVFSLGFGPIPWIMLGELFPANVKGVASAVAAAFSWILSFAVTKVFQNMTSSLGEDITFWVFTGICVVGTVFVFVMVPETKGKDLNEIQEELSGKHNNVELKVVESDVGVKTEKIIFHLPD